MRTTSQVNSVSTEQSEREWRVVARVPTGLLVNGEWVDAEGGETFEVVDPATGLVLASVAMPALRTGAARSRPR